MKMRSRYFASLFTSAVLSLLLFSSIGCKSKAAQERYPFHGVIISIETRGHQALIKHDDVPGLMKGMTMPFNIRDEKVLASLKAGDIIQATLVKQEYESWLEDIKITGSDPDYTDKPASSAVVHRPTPGEAVPDFSFTNQSGKKVSLSQLRSAPVLLTFIYARCPLPDFCPRMNANLLAVARKNSNLQLVSVSFDPEHDSPAVLRNYERQWTDDLPVGQRARWQFVIPPKDEMKDALAFFGMEAEPDQGWITHSLSTTLVGADGKVIQWYGGNQWTAEDVIQDLAVTSRAPAAAKRAE
jgi:protein SCO1/2